MVSITLNRLGRYIMIRLIQIKMIRACVIVVSKKNHLKLRHRLVQKNLQSQLQSLRILVNSKTKKKIPHKSKA